MIKFLKLKLKKSVKRNGFFSCVNKGFYLMLCCHVMISMTSQLHNARITNQLQDLNAVWKDPRQAIGESEQK